MRCIRISIWSCKELAARLIHRLSRRKDARFLALNCAALSETLLESELFGHERGAFTGAISQAKGKFELADGGTLFLDEIGEILPAMQVKLLRVLQEKEFQRVGGSTDIKVDVRLIAATNQDLPALMEQGRFRPDLYYRINVISVDLPPLRDRKEDIPELAMHFLQHFSRCVGKHITGLAPEALNLCVAYRWPGNVRELENVMEQAVTLASDRMEVIGPDLLPFHLQTPAPMAPSGDLSELVQEVEWTSLHQALRKYGSLSGLLSHLEWAITCRTVFEHGGNKSRAAKALGRTYRWLRKLEAQKIDERPL